MSTRKIRKIWALSTHGTADGVHQPPSLLARAVQGGKETGQDHGDVGEDEDGGGDQRHAREQSEVYGERMTRKS